MPGGQSILERDGGDQRVCARDAGRLHHQRHIAIAPKGNEDGVGRPAQAVAGQGHIAVEIAAPVIVERQHRCGGRHGRPQRAGQSIAAEQPAAEQLRATVIG